MKEFEAGDKVNCFLEWASITKKIIPLMPKVDIVVYHKFLCVGVQG